MDDRARIPDGRRLTRRYGRLLACYPAWHRQIHEVEMLAVLMTASPPEKRWPGIAEAADLLWGAVRIRCQPSHGGVAEPGWRDALAVLSVIVPLITLMIGAVDDARMLWSSGPRGPFAYGFPLWILTGLAPQLTMAALVPLALRWRRFAALMAAAPLAWLVYHLPTQGVSLAAGSAYFFLAAGLQIVALAASPGPRRGLQLLTGKHGAVVVIATLLVGTDAVPVNLAVRLAVIAVICAGMALTSPLGRWLLALLAIPAYPFLVGYFWLSPPGFRITSSFLPFSAALIIPYYLPPLALLILAAVAARRVSPRPS